MQNTLILYGTRKGTTTNTSNLIAETLRNTFSHSVEIVNVKNYKKVRKNINQFDNIIIGSSIVSGRWVSKALKILKGLRNMDQNLAVFVTAGGTMNKIVKYGISKSDAVKEGIEKYIDMYLLKYDITPKSKMTFGGRVATSKKIRYDNWNAEDIKHWAQELGNIFR